MHFSRMNLLEAQFAPIFSYFSYMAGARMEEIHMDLTNKANGHGVKEKVNGILHAKANGHTNGLANGLANGHANGHANGKANGVLVVPDGDARVKIRANMWSVQEDFQEYKWEIKWTHVFMLSLVHGWTLIGLMSVPYVMWQTWALRLVELVIAGLGVTAGAHRLYCHRAYKARLPLHLFLLWAYSLAGQNTLYDWVRDHRVHHKFSETDADPHNANRGWFFSHCGWLLLKKHPEVMRRGKTVDMSDITDDPLIRAHTKMFYVLKSITCHMVPVFMPMLLWDEAFWPSTNSMMIRFAIALNATWSVNSFAHLWGDRPIDKRIFPGENKIVSFFSLGEGWHNYHHVFPWDYKAAELGPSMLNIATLFLDICAWMGLAYDMKEPSKELIKRTALKHGDGSWKNHAELEPIPEPPEKSGDREKTC